MELNEMKPIFKKWEVILSENVISLTGTKYHLNAYLVYMIYCLATQKPFNLAYYMGKRMVGVIKNDKMVLPYDMLLTRLYMHVSTIQPCPLTDGHFLTPHVMVPLTKGRVKRFMVDGKYLIHLPPHPLHHNLNLMKIMTAVDNYKLDPIEYHNQLPPILGASKEFKQTKGKFKCLGNLLSSCSVQEASETLLMLCWHTSIL
ncbi:hypothetical protein Tco_0053426 [Tanacetum coccineum]